MSRSTQAVAEQDWDQVWDEYDAREARRQPPRPKAATAPKRVATTPGTTIVVARPRRRYGWLGVLLVAPLLGGAAHWVGAPVSAALQIGEAIEARDTAAKAPLMDHVAVQQAAQLAFNDIAARGPAGAQAQAFMAGMAGEMAQAWNSPQALTEVARARGVTHNASAEVLRNMRPHGMTAFDMPLGGAAPMTLRLELRDSGIAARWQVTAVRM